MSNGTQQERNSSTPQQQQLSTARFIPVTDDNGRTLPEETQLQSGEDVDFNPESLDITYTNTVQKGRSRQPPQIVSESKSKMSVELVFDTTLDGSDVRDKTSKFVEFMDPYQVIRRRPRRNPRSGQAGESQGGQSTTPQSGQPRQRIIRHKVPSIVAFNWGNIWFEGYIDNLKEKIELFSPLGIALRATVTVSMVEQKRNVNPLANDQSLAEQNNQITQDTPLQHSADNQSVTQAAQNMGDPGAARRIATQNGIENMRFPEVDVMAITDELQRRAQPIANFNIQGETSVSGSSAMLFSGLHGAVKPQLTLTPRPRLRIDPLERRDRNLSIGPNTTFGIGGNVTMGGSASLSADVGVDADLQLDIQFED